MVFTYSCWESFCKALHQRNVHSVTAKSLMEGETAGEYIVLKHDVETGVENALEIARLEHKWGHKGSYYVQAYLLEDSKNVAMLKEMQAMGHEITYHHEVMDTAEGDCAKALEEFTSNARLFRENGFEIKTVCQHGNPLINSDKYNSNRDFFRLMGKASPLDNIADIMVDFGEKCNTDYLYFSDAGRRFKLIFDPINNDIKDSEDKNIPFDSLEELYEYIKNGGSNAIISMHPHRWVASKFKFLVKTSIFKAIRAVARVLLKIPFVEKIMTRYYYIAKKL